MSAALWACALLTAGLAAYALGHYLCVLVFMLARPRPRGFPGRPRQSVAVLVPARDEGPAARRVIRSLLDQDHAGELEIHLLLKDSADSSIAFLQSQHPGVDFQRPVGGRVRLPAPPGRRVFVAYTGCDPKSDKLNWAAERLSTSHVAILDCDHQAHPDWIRVSLCLLQERGARMVQSRRQPLSALGFTQLWDALHQHVGCELFNAAFTRLGLSVYFTGTTALMESELLRRHRFRRCITEDVEFSYRLLMQGIKIISNPHCGSDEEVSPDLFSFLARRRRWANGHTDAFFRHLGKLREAPLGWRDRAQFLFHGVHYLVCVLVFALHLLIGLLFVVELPVSTGIAALLAGLVLAGFVVRTQGSLAWGTRISELLVVLGWLFPAVVIAMNLAYAALLGDLSRAALPLPEWLQLLGLAGFAAPLVLLLVGLAGFRQLNPGSLLAVVLSFPLAFYLDISGVLIGLVDFAFGRQHWHAVARAPQPLLAGAPSGLTLAVGIRDSWQPAAALGLARGALGGALPGGGRWARWLPLGLLPLIAAFGLLYTPSERIPVSDASCEILEHDGHPWIVPPAELEGYCGPAQLESGSRWGERSGQFSLLREDELASVDPEFWDSLDDTFPCNLSSFSPGNVQPGTQGGVRFVVEQEIKGDREYRSGSIASKTWPEAKFLYGRFEAELKPARGSGLISAFFLYRFDPWQEIDAEFLGRDTSKLLLNVYYNPGEEGDTYNYGFSGTPVLVDLGFDAADDFHRYAIEWDPQEIRWFVDDRLIHRRRAGQPTPIPHLPMRFHVNAWPSCSQVLAGAVHDSALPASTELRSIRLSSWQAPPSSRLAPWVERLLPGPSRSESWRDDAGWMQPGR